MLRLRCPDDSLDEVEAHLAVDLRLPAPLGAIGALPLRCPCGQLLVAPLSTAWSIWDPVPRDANGREVED